MREAKLLLLSRDNAIYRQLLQDEALPGLRLLQADSLGEAERLAPEAELILGEPARVVPILSQAQRLDWVQSTYAGVEPLVQPGMRQDYQLTNVRGIFGPLMSEYVFAHLLSLTRHLPLYREQQRQRQWHPIPYRPLAGRQMLILGTGDIGRHLARTARHFGMQVAGVNRSGREVADFDDTYQVQALAHLLPAADVIVCALPATRESFHLLDRNLLSHCKPSAILFNVGRGSAVATQDLMALLADGQLGAAVLDVFEQEPLPPNHPLWELPNLIITPHNSAWSLPEQVARIFSRNYLLWQESQPLEYQVNFEQGY